MFVAFHGVTEMWGHHPCTLLVGRKSPVIKRWKRPTANGIPGIEIDDIKTNTETFPVKVSHYT
jgi:hypothetical protein